MIMIRYKKTTSRQNKTNKPRHREAVSGRGDLSAIWQIADRLPASPDGLAHRNDALGKLSELPKKQDRHD